MDAVLTFLADHWDAIGLGLTWLVARRVTKKKATTKDIMPAKPVKR